ncbi:putative carbohydrate esterase [Cucumis melo var. makuwa]|uniref:Carbohydrate esterase n=1 Tax=Cucumis melo var. makuwa TaxID=1194695 RepID=A0A5A7V4V5_CUCMM|nr:putative carbohydrate esterase [Cucumis melo var. makuwa]
MSGMALVKLSILLCAMLFGPSLSGAVSPKNIFILGGQSNMAGRGGVEKNSSGKFEWDGVIPPDCKPNPSILRLNAARQWEVAREPLHWDIDVMKANGISPGMGFAHELLVKAGPRAGVVGLVPTAIGGTFIRQWLKNDSYPNATYYQNLVERIQASDKEGGVVRALLWFQGESDAAVKEEAINYKDNLKTFIMDLRRDIQPRFLPVIIVKIALYDFLRANATDNLSIVRAAQEAVSKEVPDVSIIDSWKLPMNLKTREGFNLDRGHFNTTIELTAGKWLADAYLSRYSRLL